MRREEVGRKESKGAERTEAVQKYELKTGRVRKGKEINEDGSKAVFIMVKWGNKTVISLEKSP